MKFRNLLFGALFVAPSYANSNFVVSRSDPRTSSSSIVEADSNEVRNSNSNGFSSASTARILKQARILKPLKKLKRKNPVKRDKKGTPPQDAVPSMKGTAIFSGPHKYSYELRTLCIPGIRMHGCSNAAKKENGGEHMHDTIRGRRYVKYAAAYAEKSICDYATVIAAGAPPDITHPIGGKLISDESSSRAKQCKAASASGSPVPMLDLTEHFKFEAIVVENSVHYNKFSMRVVDQIKTEEDTRVFHLIMTGLVADTVSYLEDMKGEPYAIQSTNGPDLLHELTFNKIEVLSEDDEERSAEEIAEVFGGSEGSATLVEVTDPRAIDIYDTRAFNKSISLPKKCNKKSPICLKVDFDLDTGLSDLGGTSFDLDFYLNGKTDASGSLTTSLTTQGMPDPKLLTAAANATGCVIDGIQSKWVTLDVKACLKGEFKYNATAGDSSPAKQTYEVELILSGSAKIWHHGPSIKETASVKLNAVSADGKEYFTGYHGEVMDHIDLVVAHASLGLGVDYEVSSWKYYHDKKKWTTKFYGKVDYKVLWHHGAFTHVFSCEPHSSKLCQSSDNKKHKSIDDSVAATTIQRNTLKLGEKLPYNYFLSSPNGQVRLWMQADGDLVAYNDTDPIWSSSTSGASVGFAQLQDDGNFVLTGYDDVEEKIWQSHTGHQDADQLVVQDDGIEILSASGSVIWSKP